MDKPIETKETVSGTTKTNDESETTEMNNVEKADEDVPLPTPQTPTSEESVPKLGEYNLIYVVTGNLRFPNVMSYM